MVVCAVFLLFVIIFASFNSGIVQLHLFLGSVNLVLSVLVLACLMLGALFSGLLFVPSWVCLKSNNRRLTVKIKQLQQEIKNLRRLPITDDGL